MKYYLIKLTLATIYNLTILNSVVGGHGSERTSVPKLSNSRLGGAVGGETGYRQDLTFLLLL